MYHYTNYTNLESIIKNRTFWITSSLAMDDKNDGIYASNCVRKMVDDKNCDYFSELRKVLCKERIENIFEQNNEIPFYSISFCEADNEYLWKNYADNYKGICICLNEEIFGNCVREIKEELSSEEISSDSEFGLLNFRNVEYGESREYIEAVGNDLKKIYGEHPNGNWLEMLLYIVSGTIKEEKYNKENEKRLLFKNIYDENFITALPAVKSTFLKLQKCENEGIMKCLGLDKLITDVKEHYSLNIEYFLEKGCISEITIGKNSDHTIEDVKKLLEENDLKAIKVLKQN